MHKLEIEDADSAGGEKAKTRGSDRTWSVLVSTVVASIIALILGASLGYPSPVLLELQSLEDPERRFGPSLSGLFGASLLTGAIFGGPIAGLAADKVGRKLSLMLCGLPFLFGYFLIVSASIATSPVAFKALLIVGIFVAGIGSGWSFLAVPVYIGEISSAKLRGLLSSFSELFLSIGTLFVYAIGLIPTFQFYHIALVMEGVVLLYMIVAAFLMPETPRWLLLRDKKEQAKKVLVYLRGPKATVQIDAEIDDIQTAISGTPDLTLLQTLKELCRKPVLVPLVLVVTVLVFQEIDGGGSVIKTYAAPIFKDTGVSNPELLGAFAIGLTQLIATAVSVLIVDLLGRKVLLIVSAAGMLVGSAMLGAHFNITRPALCAANLTNATALIPPLVDSTCNSQYNLLAIVSIVIFVVAFSLGWGPVPWVIMSEYLPLRMKGVSTGIIGVCAWLSAAVVTGIYPVYVDYVNSWFAWWTFAVINLMAIVFVAVFLVETKGKSLEDIQKHFEQKYAKQAQPFHSLENGSESLNKLSNSSAPTLE